MKRLVVSFMLLLMVLVFAGCKPKEQPVEFTPQDVMAYLANTKAAYSNSSSGNIVIDIVENDETTHMEYIYNYSGSVLESLKVVLTMGDTTMEAYVKDEVAYINVQGEKTKAALTYAEGEQIIDEFGFDALTEYVFATFDQSIFNALVIDSNEDGVVTMTWDPDKYVFLYEGLTDEEFLDADERFENISANIKAISVTVHYENDKVTKLTSTWTQNDDSVGTIAIEFKGTDEQTITYPTDLDTYQNR